MSRPLVPRPTTGEPDGMSTSSPSQKPRKISTACAACKLRKTKCSGTTPCNACATRGSTCVYDAASDQRRKVANQRNLQELEILRGDLDRHRQLLGGIIATFRAGDEDATRDLLGIIASGVDLSQLAAHVRNTRRSRPDIERAFSEIDFVIDGDEDLPSPEQLLRTSSLPLPTATNSSTDGDHDMHSSYH